MGNLLTAGLFRQMLRSATPVGLAAMGGLMTEHAGIMNIGMDGYDPHGGLYRRLRELAGGVCLAGAGRPQSWWAF